MKLGRPVCALCFDTAGNNCGACRDEQCLQTFILGYKCPPTSTYSCWTTSAIWTESHCRGLREAGLTYRRIGECIAHYVSVVCLCFQQWSVEHSHTRRPNFGRPHTIKQMHVKFDSLCEERWPPEQHPEEKFGHMLHLLYHQGPLGTVCLQRNSDHIWCFCRVK